MAIKPLHVYLLYQPCTFILVGIMRRLLSSYNQRARERVPTVVGGRERRPTNLCISCVTNNCNDRAKIHVNTYRSYHLTANTLAVARDRLLYRDHRRHHDTRGVQDNGSDLSSHYIQTLERRAKEHIYNFPINNTTSTHNAQAQDISTLLAPWNRTTVELIMLMSKAWSKKTNHHHHSNNGNNNRNLNRQSDNDRDEMQKLVKLVSLANDLLQKVLQSKKNEIDTLYDKHNLSSKSVDPKSMNNNNNTRWGQKQKDYLNTSILCQTVALGWSRCDPNIAIQAGNNANSILELLEDMCIKRGRLYDVAKVSFDIQDITPKIQLYNHVLTCWSRSLDPNAEMHARKLMDRMLNTSPEDGAFVRPDKYSYNNMLHLYANKGDVNAAEALLYEMEESNEVEVDVFSYSITMNAFQKRFTSSKPSERDMKDPVRAEELLIRLVTKYEQSRFNNELLRPSNVTFGTVIAMYAQSDRLLKEDQRLDYTNKTRNWRARNISTNVDNKNVGWGASNAERVLDWIIGLSERERRSKLSGSSSDIPEAYAPVNNERIIRPTSFHFTTVMDAWAKCGKGQVGAERCERLLERLISLYETHGYNEIRPNPFVFGTVINAWSNADNKYETAEKAEFILGRAEDLFLNNSISSNPKYNLSNIVYNLVIDAWSRRSGSDTAERAEQVLERLLNNHHQTKNRFLRPDVITYTNVMKAFVNHPNGGEKAVKILEEMNNQYRDGNNRAKPDIKALSVAMDACSKNGMTIEAERILNDIDDEKKNNIMFNTIISGYKSEGLGDKAEALLRRMISLENSGFRRCSPDRISYASCIEAWGNSSSDDRVTRAKALLNESIKRYQSGDNNCKPSPLTFNSTASCILKSEDPESPAQILALFESMEAMGVEIGLVSFNILLKACATPTENKEEKALALQIAASTFNSLPATGLRPNSITYTSMIHALKNLIEDPLERTQAITGIFQQCCKDGCVNQSMMNILAKATTDNQFKSITGYPLGKKNINELPSAWSRRASEAG